MINFNKNLLRIFPTRVSRALRYAKKVVRCFAGLGTIPDLIYLLCGSGVFF